MEQQPTSPHDKKPFNYLEEGLDLSNPRDFELYQASAGDLILLDLERQRLKFREMFERLGTINIERYYSENAELDQKIIDRQRELGLIPPEPDR